MSVKPDKFYNMTNEQLLKELTGGQVGSELERAVEGEFRRRALVAQAEAAEAAGAAARATETTARWTRFSAIAIAVSVVVMAIGAWVSA